jgi:uncharacterized protein YkwD
VEPPLRARVIGALTRRSLPARRVLRHRSSRLALGVAIVTAVTAALLAVPVVAGDADLGTSPVALDASSSAESGSPRQGSPVVMGVDGAEISSSWFAGVRASGSSGGETQAAPDTSSVVRVPSGPRNPPDAARRSAPVPSSSGSSSQAGTTAGGAPSGTLSDQSSSPASSSSSEQPALPDTATPEDVAADAAAQMLALVNQERAAVSCDALAADSGLAAVAAAHSADMRDRGFFDHVDPDGLGPSDRAEAAGLTARAENIARGQQDAAAAMAAWLASDEHRANILDCEFTRLGVGVAEGPGGPWWTQLFA